MRSKLYLVFSIILGLYIIYGLYTMLSRLNSYRAADIIVLLVLFAFFGVIEFIFIKKYKKYSDPEYIRQEKELELNAQNERRAIKERAAHEKFEKQKLIPGTKERLFELGADLCIRGKHMAGLPIAESAEVFVYRCKDKVIFERNQDAMELKINKVRDIFIKTDAEIQKSYVSSAGGAIAGYARSGELGALIGGRVQEKTDVSIEKYLIFAYEKNGEIDYISLEVTYEAKAYLFYTDYYDLSKNGRRITNL